MDVVFTLFIAVIVMLSTALFIFAHDKKELRKHIEQMEIDQRFDCEARYTTERFREVYERIDALEARPKK
jgi:hypothetical protein